MIKTNAMRKLEEAGIAYESCEYAVDEEDLSGVHTAQILGISPDSMFKTLVTRGERKGIQVFCLPVEMELDFKKCASVSGDKRVEMVSVAELLPLTGYVRGGCSPVGMKRPYPTYIDETATLFDRIYVSAGRRGCQLIVRPTDLAHYIGAIFADITQ